MSYSRNVHRMLGECKGGALNTFCRGRKSLGRFLRKFYTLPESSVINKFCLVKKKEGRALYRARA